MGMMDKFKNFMGIPDDEYEDYDENPDEQDSADDMERYQKPAKSKPQKPKAVEPEPEQPSVAIPDWREDYNAIKNDNKVVTIPATTQLQVVLVKPEHFEDASGVADYLNAKRTVVLNLESTNRDVSRRLVDFLSGVAYANGGQIKKVANSTYIITPYNVGVVGDSLLDELENNGIFS